MPVETYTSQPGDLILKKADPLSSPDGKYIAVLLTPLYNKDYKFIIKKDNRFFLSDVCIDSSFIEFLWKLP